MAGVTIVVSVDWEGRSLLDENLERIREFRERFAHVPLQHFLNAAYYTKSDADPARATQFIAHTISSGDECGLHVHAWRSLVEAAGVEVRTQPTFIDRASDVPKALDDWEYFAPEDGYDVPLEAYETHEAAAIVRTSRAILTRHGFSIAPSFRAGGWMSGPKVQAALAAENMLYDCSPVYPELAIRRFGDMPLCRWLSELWPGIGDISQPYPAPSGMGYLWLVPDNAGLIDYTPEADFAAILERHFEACEKSGTGSILVTGFHQETARVFLPRLEVALAAAERIAGDRSVPLSFAAQMPKLLGRAGNSGFP